MHPIRPTHSIITLATAILSITQIAHAQSTILHCGTLIAIPGEPSLEQVSILITDGLIIDIQDGYITPETWLPDEPNTQIIDLTGSFVLPGLIDTHTHLTGENLPAAERMRRRLQESETHAAIDGVANAKKTILAGFTTVRNVGSPGTAALALRDRPLRRAIGPDTALLLKVHTSNYRVLGFTASVSTAKWTRLRRLNSKIGSRGSRSR